MLPNKGKRNRLRLILPLAGCLLLAAPWAQAAGDAVSLQLKWRHAFQFAGFYMALEKGYYRQEGLDVSLIEGGPGRHYIDHVLEPGANYSVADSSALLARAQGKPVKAIAAIFQHSPLALLVLRDSGINSITDLRGKRIMIQPSLNADILAALNKAGIGRGDFIQQPISYDIRDLIDGRTDAYSAYITDQPHQLDRLGIPYRILHPNDYGIDFYGDTLITSERETQAHPERVAAFLRASIRGWVYALEHQDEAINLILRKYNTQHFTPDQLYFEAEQTAAMIMKDVVQIGYMSNYRWQQIANAYAGQGLLPKGFSVADFVYTPEPGISELISTYRWQIAVFGLFSLMLALTLHSIVLRRRVRARTETLKESEERFRTLVDNLPGAAYRCRLNAQRSISFISKEIETISGHTAYAFISGSRIYDALIHPHDRTRVHQSIRSALTDKAPFAIEYRICRADGTVRWVMEKGQGIFDPNGHLQWLDGNITDINERKRAETLQNATSEILEMIANNIEAETIFARIIETFEARQPDMRASVLRLEGERLYNSAAPSLPDAYNRLIEGFQIGPQAGSCGTAAFTGQRVIVENIETSPLWAPYLELIRPFPMLSCWSEPVLDANGKVVGTFAMYHDRPCTPSEEELSDISNAAKLASIVIERERNYQRLHILSQAMEQAGEVIMLTDCNGIIEYVNPAFSRNTGYAAEEAIGQTPAILKSGHQDDAFYQRLWETISNGGAWQGKVIEQRKDGSFYPAMLTISPVRNQEGVTTHYIGVHEDLTELERMEEQFHRAQKMDAIGTLVGGIAHDFNNMLAGITGNVYLARNRTQETGQIDKPLEKIEQIALRASDMIAKLLTFSNKGIVERNTFSLSRVLQETLELQRVSVPENIRLQVDICNDALPVHADATQFHQIVLNLLTNARDATVRAQHPAIVIRLRSILADGPLLQRHPTLNGEHLAHLSISDNGEGIRPEHIDNIFEPFFTTKEVGKGTGLGLAMVFGAVRASRGAIEVESEPGAGTTFHIYLPLAETDSVKNGAETDLGTLQGSGETILLADDEAMVIEANSEVLSELGYRVVTASNGREAVAAFRAHTIDLVILDLVMPEMNGIQAAQEIRRIDEQAKIIFATGYDRDAILGGREDGADETIISKPYSVNTLSQTIRSKLT